MEEGFLREFFEKYIDYLAPKLDTYEQAIYLYVFRQGRFLGKDEVVIGFKTSRIAISLGSGIKGTPMAESTCYEKLKSLQSKGCINILGSEHGGTRVKLILPDSIVGLIPESINNEKLIDIESIDFFTEERFRKAILVRENYVCFYCLAKLTEENYVIEHVESRPKGNNSYRNLVAACRTCNNRKGNIEAEHYFRILFREGYLNKDEFEEGLLKMRKLKQGEMIPQI